MRQHGVLHGGGHGEAFPELRGRPIEHGLRRCTVELAGGPNGDPTQLVGLAHDLGHRSSSSSARRAQSPKLSPLSRAATYRVTTRST